MERRERGLLENIDWATILTYLALVLIGWISIYSAVYDEAHKSIFDLDARYGKQLIWIGVSLLIALFSTTWGICSRSVGNLKAPNQMGFWLSFGTGGCGEPHH